jgi:perosamine synthetase
MQVTMPVDSQLLERRFVTLLTAVVHRPQPVPLHEPEFAGDELAYLKACIDSGWVSSAGKYVDEFEHRLAKITGSRFVVATVNGTAALHIALKLAGVQPGDEVMVPSLTFVATANAVAHCGAIPHFVESDPRTLGLDARALREYLEFIAERSGANLRNRASGRRLAAVVPMHTYGHPVDLVHLVEVCRQFGLPLVEDAAESLGSLFHGRHTGTFGKLGTLSFNGNKIVTTGGGGAILTQEESLARHARHITTTARRDHRWEYFHDEVGWNYRLPNLNAALGCAQLERLESLLTRKRALAMRYRDAVSAIPELRFADEPEGCRSNFWLNTVLLGEPSLKVRDSLLAASNDAGFMTRPAWTLLHKLPMFADCPRAPVPVAEQLEASIINVPSSPNLVPGDAR